MPRNPCQAKAHGPTTTVAPQALMLMNSPQVRAWAEALAKRIEADGKSSKDANAHVARAYAICFGRSPTSEEASSAAAFISQQSSSYEADKKGEAPMHALADFCQVLFGLNEFVYQP